MAAEEVVLPTPPLPDVITIILANSAPFQLFVRFTHNIIKSVHGIFFVVNCAVKLSLGVLKKCLYPLFNKP